MVPAPPSISALVDDSYLIVTVTTTKTWTRKTRYEVVELLKGVPGKLDLLKTVDWGTSSFEGLQVVMIGPPPIFSHSQAYGPNMRLRQIRRVLAGFTPVAPPDDPGFLAHEADVILRAGGLGREDDSSIVVVLDDDAVLKGDPGPTFQRTLMADGKPRFLNCLRIEIPHGHVAEFEHTSRGGVFFLSKDQSGQLASITDTAPHIYYSTSQATMDRLLAEPKPEIRRPPERSRYFQLGHPPPPGPAPQ